MCIFMQCYTFLKGTVHMSWIVFEMNQSDMEVDGGISLEHQLAFS